MLTWTSSSVEALLQHCGLPEKVYLQYDPSVQASHDRFLLQTSESEAQDGIGFSVIGKTLATPRTRRGSSVSGGKTPAWARVRRGSSVSGGKTPA